MTWGKLKCAGVLLFCLQWAVGGTARVAEAQRAAPVARSTAAATQAGSWFNNSQEVFLQRIEALTATDVDLWEAAVRKSKLTATRADLGFTMPKFNPLFDARHHLVPGASGKFAKRLGQLPQPSVQNWQQLTGGEALVVAMSLAAENGLFPRETFSPQAFRAFLARFK